MPKLPTARSADGDTIDVKPYPPTSPKKSGAKQPKKQASPSEDVVNDVKPSGLASPKKAAGKQTAKKWSKEDKIDILLKVVQTASPDWQATHPPVAEIGRKGDEVGVRGRRSIIKAVEASEAIVGS
ncbi:hypothetical protein HD553DRAFT_325328 [Filobasidium floriforme]|uniref:uncharacterized protein n=1 Tax=Filobasidium floriforme TaxID=5210 RepID=UPI001E8EC5DD|nr:uncharacterized protein HD553DRAFT_325328 [Filobasidium floriforme]KAH8081884.1 hypothetical protein HD553DRAFT_325328 [Filobasidium floriforme]